MHAGPAHTVSAEEGGWVTSETAAGQNFIGNQYFVFSSSLTSVQVLSEVLKKYKILETRKKHSCDIYYFEQILIKGERPKSGKSKTQALLN